MDIKSSKTKLFLIELIVVIFFFAVSSVVCVNIFTNARLISISSTDVANAMLRAQTAAETIRASNEPRSPAMFSGAVERANGYTVYYDKDWGDLSGAADAAYEMNVAFSGDARLIKASITVLKKDEELFHIDTARYVE